jgi:hypothetical protein
MDKMETLTHPVELSGEELNLVAAGWSQNQNCGCDREGSFINVETGNINVLSGNNVAVLSAGFVQAT